MDNPVLTLSDCYRNVACCCAVAEINACAVTPAPCDGNATCTDNPPPSTNATCQCKPGFVGSGLPGSCTGRWQPIWLGLVNGDADKPKVRTACRITRLCRVRNVTRTNMRAGCVPRSGSGTLVHGILRTLPTLCFMPLPCEPTRLMLSHFSKRTCCLFAILPPAPADFNACQAIPSPCDANATCTDEPAPSLNATCRCKDGFTGNGQPGNCTGRSDCGL